MTPTKVGNVLNWASELDENALEQAKRTADLPFVQGHLALMADAHVGYGSTVGSVIPTKGAIIPSGGRRRHRLRHDRPTVLTSNMLPDDLQPLHDRIAKAIPSGMGKGHEKLGRPRSVRRMRRAYAPS